MSIVSEKWSSFTLRIPVKADVQKVYERWTTREGLESWFLRKAEFTRPDGIVRHKESSAKKGDRYEWLWHGYGDEDVERREVLEANGKDLFQFVFSGDCIVTISIYKEQNQTIVELKQENIPLDEDPKRNLCLNCSGGWTFYMTNLKSILEGGLDLRNKDVSIKSVVNA